jgi:hypothetical protein
LALIKGHLQVILYNTKYLKESYYIISTQRTDNTFTTDITTTALQTEQGAPTKYIVEEKQNNQGINIYILQIPTMRQQL